MCEPRSIERVRICALLRVLLNGVQSGGMYRSASVDGASGEVWRVTTGGKGAINGVDAAIAPMRHNDAARPGTGDAQQ